MGKKIIVLLIVLLIGAASAAAQERSHTVQRGENLTRIARLYGVSVQSIITRNNLANPNRILPGQVLIIPSTTPPLVTTPVPPTSVTTYTVQRGDTLNTIAARFGLSSWRQIGAFNNLQTPNVIFAGQVLQIPPASYVPPASYQPNLSAGQGGGALPPQQTITYIVRQGDTLDSIARVYNTTQAAILQANNLVTTVVIPGQVLLVPLNTVVVQPTPLPIVQPPAVVLPTPVNNTPIRGPRYVVQPGDTMIQIGRRANRSPWAIAAANGIYNLNRIFVGQVLIIP
ncbi:LysM peptidoglycan-binding domain-containing protein [Aggregatilineales bacterium SYSU G02658]